MEANYFYPYHRSQKTSALQKDSGLYAANCGMSLQGLSAGQILGYSTTPRNMQQLKADLSKDHANYISQQLHRVNEVSLQITLINIWPHTHFQNMLFKKKPFLQLNFISFLCLL